MTSSTGGQKRAFAAASSSSSSAPAPAFAAASSSSTSATAAREFLLPQDEDQHGERNVFNSFNYQHFNVPSTTSSNQQPEPVGGESVLPFPGQEGGVAEPGTSSALDFQSGTAFGSSGGQFHLLKGGLTIASDFYNRDNTEIFANYSETPAVFPGMESAAGSSLMQNDQYTYGALSQADGNFGIQQPNYEFGAVSAADFNMNLYCYNNPDAPQQQQQVPVDSSATPVFQHYIDERTGEIKPRNDEEWTVKDLYGDEALWKHQEENPWVKVSRRYRNSWSVCSSSSSDEDDVDVEDFDFAFQPGAGTQTPFPGEDE
eukprot:GSA120T00025487001.1